ncbi:MAG TPA: hypothetical protein VN673_14655, partial [Clostridia bacterium]|nr:hypothetical protein [Clostridia bacterium]
TYGANKNFFGKFTQTLLQGNLTQKNHLQNLFFRLSRPPQLDRINNHLLTGCSRIFVSPLGGVNRAVTF